MRLSRNSKISGFFRSRFLDCRYYLYTVYKVLLLRLLDAIGRPEVGSTLRAAVLAHAFLLYFIQISGGVAVVHAFYMLYLQERRNLVQVSCIYTYTAAGLQDDEFPRV